MTPFDRRIFTHINWSLVGLTLILFGLGVLNLYSASTSRLEEGMAVDPFYHKQLLWGLMGMGALLAALFVDYRHLRVLAWPLFGITVVLLLAVPMWGKSIYGAQRWLDLGLFNFQPSELAKIAILLLGAKILSKGTTKLDLPGLIKVLAVGAIPAGLVIMQPDLGSGLTILLLLGGIVLYRGLTTRVFKVAVVILPVVLVVGFFFLHDYQKQRIMTFISPGSDPQGAGYHIIQSQIAIGSGKFWGKGFLEGTQSQLRFLPEKHTDFAVAVFGEEWGFVGTVTLVALFCLFLYSIFITARDAKDLFGSYLAAGVFFYFFWQIVINMGMVLGLMPVVGIPLPFISYGGSATLANFLLVGLVLNVSMRRYVFKQA